MNTDTQRFDWLEKVCYACPNLVNDDDGNWAVSFDGFQPCPRGDGNGFDEPVSLGIDVEPEMWKPTVREAIDLAMENFDKEL